MENWKRYLDRGEILLKTDLTKLNHLLTVLNSMNDDIQFTVELSENKLQFLDILITKTDE